MILQTLLVSKDDLTAEALIKALVQFGVVVDRSNAVDVAMTRLAEERYDQVIVDFDDPEAASQLLEGCRDLAAPEHKTPITVALLRDASQIRSILGAGAHFILIKPVGDEQAHNTFRAATALLKRERRQSSRIAVQAEITLRVSGENASDENSSGENSSNGSNLVEGILLDLSTGGMDVLAAKTIPCAAVVHVCFALPENGGNIEGEAEVAWSAGNGQIGLRFLEMDAAMRQQMGAWLAAHAHNTLPGEPDAVNPCKLTDLSLGGCYVQTASPFPQSSSVDLCLRAAGLEIHTEGLVRVMHPSHGMGIEFPARTAEQRKTVEEFIEFLTSQPDAAPELVSSPRALVANVVDLNQTGGTGSEHKDSGSEDAAPESSSADDRLADDSLANDPLLELLRTGCGLDEEEFLAELHRQRTPVSVAE